MHSLNRVLQATDRAMTAARDVLETKVANSVRRFDRRIRREAELD